MINWSLVSKPNVYHPAQANTEEIENKLLRFQIYSEDLSHLTSNNSVWFHNQKVVPKA